VKISFDVTFCGAIALPKDFGMNAIGMQEAGEPGFSGFFATAQDGPGVVEEGV
jgi:hypothetical protein